MSLLHVLLLYYYCNITTNITTVLLLLVFLFIIWYVVRTFNMYKDEQSCPFIKTNAKIKCLLPTEETSTERQKEMDTDIRRDRERRDGQCYGEPEARARRYLQLDTHWPSLLSDNKRKDGCCIVGTTVLPGPSCPSSLGWPGPHSACITAGELSVYM